MDSHSTLRGYSDTRHAPTQWDLKTALTSRLSLEPPAEGKSVSANSSAVHRVDHQIIALVSQLHVVSQRQLAWVTMSLCGVTWSLGDVAET
ncbi:hypothetical protein BaRGS_00010004 [Batillaria attramentaria]|uniref:Uncharacterized protein n=1 Tax=Batillaria attramentaria TaxID=370345 RepID=A0ABD0LIM1_9CAEN